MIAIVYVFQWYRRIIRYRPKRFTALLRFIAYKQIEHLQMTLGTFLVSHEPAGEIPPYLSSSQILNLVWWAMFIWCFQMKPYYRPGVQWGSAPLGLRTGYIATGLCPFVFALGSRINPIAWVTRLPHERWMVYHRYGARVIRERVPTCSSPPVYLTLAQCSSPRYILLSSCMPIKSKGE